MPSPQLLSSIWLFTDQSCRISNPLAGIPKHILLEDAAAFAQETGLTEQTELLQKGALVAQDPGLCSLYTHVHGD